jgi:hypothetical protein
LQPTGPFWVLEYVTKHNKRKDYEDNMQKYERELKVPYYLLFYPDNREPTLFHLSSRKYRSVPPTSGAVMPSRNWTWKRHYWMTGCVSGTRANFSLCPRISNATWTKHAANCER